MNYSLNKKGNKEDKSRNSTMEAIKQISPYLKEEKKTLTIAFLAIFVSSILNLISPMLISYTIDNFIQSKNFQGVLMLSGVLMAIYLALMIASYIQSRTMGSVGRRVLFKLRNDIFTKLQELPIAFFNENKTGDLISRINNDTDKLNQFFSQALMQFVNHFFLMIGTGVLLIVINTKLGLASLAPALLVIIITQVLSNWVKKRNLKSLQSLGGLSAEIQESLDNFKVIVAFNRQDYFKDKFNESNDANYKASVNAGVASNIFVPIYGLASNLAQLIALALGIYLITTGSFSVGLLIGYFMYVNSFYSPLRQMASVWSTFQLSIAAMERISDILKLKSNLKVIKSEQKDSKHLLEFKNVSFGYSDCDNGKDDFSKLVLNNVNLYLDKGKTYALIGPTGGGKTTTASLIARLYDPSNGEIILKGKDLRAYSSDERTKTIGFILQEPFLFSGTIRDNILYGNNEYAKLNNEELRELLEKFNLSKLLSRFDKGLDTAVSVSGNTISLGQKQLIAFIRAILRQPEILILDEATANIDTVTEQLLEEILNTLPSETTKIIIAHRLNTINNADQVFFVNGGDVVLAGSLNEAIDMLINGKRSS